jgi:hypothetical protein
MSILYTYISTTLDALSLAPSSSLTANPLLPLTSKVITNTFSNPPHLKPGYPHPRE